MNGPLAQIVALTCHGNAFLAGRQIPQFFPKNSTCQFCDSISFIRFKKTLLGKVKEAIVAVTPDEWFSKLRELKAVAIRLIHEAQDNPRISDRMSAGFVGGGRIWKLEVLREGGRSEFWMARWEVWNQKAPDRRIWRVTYGVAGEDRTKSDNRRPISAAKADLKATLESIHAFSARQDCGGFTKCFADALVALNDPSSDIGYHKDLAIPDQLTQDVASMLKASMSAWVFGGMGSWNDMGFEGATQQEYEKVSEQLFNILNEAVGVAASSTVRLSAPVDGKGH